MKKFTNISLKSIGFYNPWFPRRLLIFLNFLFLLINKEVFLPSTTEHKKTATRAAIIFLVTLSCLLLIISLPPIMDFILKHNITPELKKTIINDKIAIKLWIGWGCLFLEIAGLLLLGGAIWGEWSTKTFRDNIESFEKSKVKNTETDRDNILTRINEKTSDIKKYIQQYKTSKSLKEKYLIMVKLYNLAVGFFDNIPEYQGRYIIVMFFTRFPGGLYGLFAFTLFSILAVLKVGQLYLNNSLFN